MMLHDVNVTDFILTGPEYVRRRIGFTRTLREFMEFNHRPYNLTDDEEHLEAGDVLMWHITPYTVNCCTRLVNNFPISSQIKFEYQYGVYESDGVVSSIPSTVQSSTICPSIAIAMLSEMKTPDRIIKISDLLKVGLVSSRSDYLFGLVSSRSDYL